MPNPAVYVRSIHFEDFSGSEFERLAFAYHLRAYDWKSLEWYGQVGNDLGRDIWGVALDGETVCIQCVNREGLSFEKIRGDLAKVLSAVNGVPSRFRVITRANVSAGVRDKIKSHLLTSGVNDCDIWSGSEFEERLRHRDESLLKRFVEGEQFPDTASELAIFVAAGGLFSSNESTPLTTETAAALIESYRIKIQDVIGPHLPPLEDNLETPARGQSLIERLLLPSNAFLIGPSGTTKTFHLEHLAVAMTKSDREFPVLVDAKNYTGGDFWSHARRCSAHLFRGDLSDLMRAADLLELRPVLLLDALNECASGHLDTLLKGIQEFVLQRKARLVGTSQAIPALSGDLVSETIVMPLPNEGEKETIYAYHAGLPKGEEVRYLCAPFTNAYDLEIAGICHASQSSTPTRVDLYDRYTRRSLPNNTAVISALLRSIAGEMSSSLSLVMSRTEFARKAEQFLTNQNVGLSALDELVQCRLLKISEDVISFEHELLFDYFRAEHFLRRFSDISILCDELCRPRNQDLFELVLPRFTRDKDIETIVMTASSADTLCRVIQGKCGSEASRLLQRKCLELLDAAREDLANISVECGSTVLEDGRVRFVGVDVKGNRSWSKHDQQLCAVIADSLTLPEVRSRFLSLFDATEQTLKNGAYSAANASRFKSLPVWGETIRDYSGTLQWGEMKLPCTAILSEIRHSRMGSKRWTEILPIHDELLQRASAEDGRDFALHVLARGWHYGGATDVGAKLALAARGIASGIQIIQLDSIDLLQWMRRDIEDTSEAQMQRARDLLENFDTKDVMLNSQKLEVLAAYGGLELFVTEEESLAEMRRLIHADEPRSEILERADLEGVDLARLRNEWAYGCIGKIFEDIFQGVYYEAYQALDHEEKKQLLCLAAMAERPGFFTDWILLELHNLEGPEIGYVFAHHASGIDSTSFSPQEAVAAYMLAIQGCAKNATTPPKYREPISTDDQAWKIIGEILFWHFRLPLSQDEQERIDALWRSLAEATPNAAADVFYNMSHSHWRVSTGAPIRLDLLNSDRARPLLELAIQHRTDLTSIFPHGGFRDKSLMLYILSTLGQIGTTKTIDIVKELVEDPQLGKQAIAAIAALRSR